MRSTRLTISNESLSAEATSGGTAASVETSAPLPAAGAARNSLRIRSNSTTLRVTASSAIQEPSSSSVSEFIVASGVRGLPCMDHSTRASRKRAKSNDGFVRGLTKSSVLENSRLLPKRYGRSTRPLTSRALQGKMSVQALVGCQASSSLRASFSQPS